MTPTFSLIQNPTNKYPGLELYLSRDVHSGVENFRELIRQFLWNKLSQKGLNENLKASILDLNNIPTEAENYFFNLSHSKKGSLIAISKNKKVGVDIEDMDRISDGLIERVSTPEELAQTPEPTLLFSAKEACWKACEKQWDIATISQIETTGWRAQNNNWRYFSAAFKESPLPGKGWVLVISGTCLSFFICP